MDASVKTSSLRAAGRETFECTRIFRERHFQDDKLEANLMHIMKGYYLI